MCDTYSFGQSSEIIQQSDYSSSNNMIQLNDHRLRAELLEMQLQESQQREQHQIKLNEQLFKAFQEADQRLKEFSEANSKKKEFQFILEQHDKYIQQVKDNYDQQISKLRTELDSIVEENEQLKKANQLLEDQKFAIWGDKESKQNVLTQENHIMQQQIKMLREEINVYKSNSILANQKLENEVKQKYQQLAQEEKLKLENEMMQMQQTHTNEIKKLQDQNLQNEMLWSKKLDIANQQRAIMEKYKANDQMLYEMHKENTLEELQTLKKVNQDQSIQIDKLKQLNQQYQIQLVRLQECEKELNECKKNKTSYDQLLMNFKDLESKYVEEKAENEMLKMNLQNIQFEMRSSVIEQQLQKDELKKQLTHERKRSIDLNNKIHENQEDYLKKKFAIVKEILQQDNKIKELSKQLSKSQLIAQQQSQQLRQSQVINQQNTLQLFSPSSDKDASQNISNILNFNSSQQTIQCQSSKQISIEQQKQKTNSPKKQSNQLLNDTIQSTQNTQKVVKEEEQNRELRQKPLQTSKSNSLLQCSKQNSKIQSNSSLNKQEQNTSLLKSPSYFQAKKKISFDNKTSQQTQKKDNQKSSVIPSLNIQRSPSAYLKRTVCRNGISSDQNLVNKSVRENNNMEDKRISLNTTYNVISNNSNNNSLYLNSQTSPKDSFYNFKPSGKTSTNKSNLKSKNLSYQFGLNSNSKTEMMNHKSQKQGQENNQNNSNLSEIQQQQNQNQSLSVAQYIKNHSNSQHHQQENNQSYNLNGQFLQHQMSFNQNLLNDSSLGKMSFLNSAIPANNNISYSQLETNNLQSEQYLQNENAEYSYNSQNYSQQFNYNSNHTQSNVQAITSPKTQNSHSIYNNSCQNGYQPDRGYIIQNIQSQGTQETAQTLQTLQNSLTINQNDSMRFNKSYQINKQNQIQEEKNQGNTSSILNNQQTNNQIQNQGAAGQIPSVKFELHKDIPQQGNYQNSEDQQSEIIVSQCRILNEDENLKTSQDYEDNLMIQHQTDKSDLNISNNLSVLHQFNKENNQTQQMHGQEQRDSSKSKMDKINSNANLLRYCYEEKENLNQSQLNKKSSTQGYQRYSYMGCVNDYSYLSKKKNKFSDMFAPSVANTSVCKENDESFNLFSKQFLQSNQMNPSYCSEQDRMSILNNRKYSDINLNFNSDSIYGQNKIIPQKIIVIDQIHENSQTEQSNISQSCHEKQIPYCNLEAKIQQNKRQETEEGNLEVNEFENDSDLKRIQVNLVEMKNQSKFLQKY